MKKTLLCLMASLFVACGNAATPASTATLLPPVVVASTVTATSEPAPTVEPPTPTATTASEPTATAAANGPLVYRFDVAPEKIHYDFYAQYCDAQWSNSGQQLPCPGDPADSRGSVSQYTGLANNADLLLTIPAFNESFAGLFGHYPAYTVQTGDIFQARLSVLAEKDPCSVDFGLAYFDAQKQFHELTQLPGIANVGGLRELVFDLSALAEQTVEFTLVVRYQGPTRCQAVWFSPIIYQR